MPVCPRCTKAVYAAEQVLGPGRKFYHKPCLACTTCNKRLDSFTLLEHDEEPYCKSCHAKNFGTHNVPNRSVLDPLRTPPKVQPDATQLRTPPTVQSDATQFSPTKPSNTGRFGPSDLPRTVQLSPTPIPEDAELSHQDEDGSRAMSPVAERYASAAAVQRRHMTGETTPPRSLPVPRTLTGGGSPSPRRYGTTNPSCARCAKSVFFAEQAKAVGKIYHKSCLRCVVCATSLDSNRLRDHDGEPHCSRCYTKLWGPGGLDK